jgi:hypothetical protein
MLSVQIDKGRRVLGALSRSLPWPIKKRTRAAVRYSPRGIGDERPNARDSRYTFPVGDEPVELPLQPQRTAYLIAALVIVLLVVMTVAATNL